MKANGFSLIEVAIVLVLMGLLLGGLAPPISHTADQMRRSDTARQLQQIRDALLGFAAAYGRLPCPAGESGAVPVRCSTAPANHGFLSARDLGLEGPVDEQGRLLDPWSRPFRYAVTIANGGAFTATEPLSQMRAVGMGSLAPHLFICPRAAGCSWAAAKVRSLPVIFYSTGAHGADTSSPEELENMDANDAFVEHAYSTAPGSEFDDLVAWISPHVLYAKMIAAGQLP